MTKTGATLSVNSSQTQITQVGILTNLAFNVSILLNVVAAVSGTTYSSASLLADGYGIIVSGGLTQGVGSTARFEMKNGGAQRTIASIDGAGNATFQ